MEFSHKSVLLEETIEGLAIKPEGIYVDGTLGGAGHSSVIAGRLSGQGHLIGIDQDAAAIAAATERLQPFAEHVTIVRSNYENMCQIIKDNGYAGVDGILLDLGVSSYQLDTVERGFSYKYDTKLDMRMDERQTLTARDIVNGYSETELFHIIRDYGEDKFAKNIAKHIVLAREEKPIETTYELNEIIKAAIPAKMRSIDNIICQVNADYYLPIDKVSIPTGEILKVEGTPFDFRTPKTIGQDIDADNEQIKNGQGYDHNFVLNKKEEGELSFAAKIKDPVSCRTMEVYTTEPGLQMYTGNFLTGISGQHGATFPRRSAVCFEAQKFPDTPNHPYFPSCRLKPGDTYTQKTIYKFGVEK